VWCGVVRRGVELSGVELSGVELSGGARENGLEKKMWKKTVRHCTPLIARCLCAWLGVLTPWFSARAATQVDLTLVADPDTRFFDLLSGAFAQIVPVPPVSSAGTHEDGYFSIPDEPDYPIPYEDYNSRTFDFASFHPVLFFPVGDGTPDEFPHERHFQSDYAVTYQAHDGIPLIGVGVESAQIVAAELDFWHDFANGDLLGVVGYETRIAAVGGAVHFRDGQVEGFDATIDLSFSYDFSLWGGSTEVEFPGTLTLDGRRWTLFADGIYDPPEFGLDNPVRAIWDGHGYLAGLYESGVSGDFNNDGVVDVADYSVWRDSLGAREGTLPNDPAGGDITVAQYEAWRNNFGATQSPNLVSANTSVPEPTSIGLLAFFAAACLQRSPQGLSGAPAKAQGIPHRLHCRGGV
jgi:hypothetical protein